MSPRDGTTPSKLSTSSAALAALDKSYPWGRNKPRRQIASITATLGAELLIEYESVEVEVLRSTARQSVPADSRDASMAKLQPFACFHDWCLDILAPTDEGRALTLGLKLGNRRATVTFSGVTDAQSNTLAF